ncbi:MULTISPECIES: hypothetical protein [Xenorhabdus]|nr:MULTISPECIES: hypothetical protein [Xenorhabdus]
MSKCARALMSSAPDEPNNSLGFIEPLMFTVLPSGKNAFVLIDF